MNADTHPPLPTPTRTVSRLRWALHLVFIGTYPLLITLMGRMMGEGRGPALSSTAMGLLRVSIYGLLFFALLFGLAWVFSRATRDDLLLRWRGGFWPVPLGIGYAVALRISVGLIIAGIALILILTRAMTPDSLRRFFENNRPDVETLVDISAMRDNPAYFWLTITFVSFVVAGLREELWRSAFLAGLKNLSPRFFGSRLGQVGAVAIAAVVFGLGHLGMGVIAVVMTGILGFGLGLIMVFHKSIWPAVLAHGFFDAMTMALLPWLLDTLHRLPSTAGH